MSIITNDLINDLIKNPKSHKSINYIGKGGEGYIFEINNEVIKIYIKYDINLVLKEFFVTGLLQEINHINSNVIHIKNYYLSYSHPIMVMEKMDGNLGDFVTDLVTNKIPHECDEMWLSFIFQSIYGFNFLNNRLHILHNDSKIKNILYRKNINEKEYIYKINHIKYRIPADYVFKIADFGFVQILGLTLNKISDEEILKKIADRDDFREISKIIERIIVNYMIKEFTYEQALKFAMEHPEFKKMYDEQVRKVDIDLASYPGHIRKNFIFRYICYYLAEVDEKYTNIIKEKYKLKLPSKKVRDILNNIMTADDPFKLFDMFII